MTFMELVSDITLVTIACYHIFFFYNYVFIHYFFTKLYVFYSVLVLVLFSNEYPPLNMLN